MHQEQKEYQTLILTEVPDISEDNGEAQRLLDLTRSEILSSFQNVVPLSQTSPEKINQIRNWGKERAVPASGRPIGEEQLPARTGKLDPRFLEKVLETIRKDFPEIRCLGQFLGILAFCRIDDSYDVHMLDFQGQVIRHFHKGEPLPEGLEKGRNLALYGGYAFVEVYTDCCRGVFGDGQVAVIPD